MPVLVDAAAEILTVPNVHLQLGADLVGYSGGKCLRGPQAAGLLLGRKDLVKAAWVGSAPHHGFGRGFKVGKEEAIGMLMAVEMWFKRDHEAEWKQWQGWIDEVARRVKTIDGVSTSVTQPEASRTACRRCRSAGTALGSASAARRSRAQLFETAPRVSLFPARGKLAENETGLNDRPLHDGSGRREDRRGAHPRRAFGCAARGGQAAAPPAADLTGTWEVRIQYAASASTHALHLRQRGNVIEGMHQGDFVTRAARGTIDGDAVRIRSDYPESHGDALGFTFSGRLAGDEMGGELDMGEYQKASWTAKRVTLPGGPEPCPRAR